MAPAGMWFSRVSYRLEVLDASRNRQSNPGTLLAYVISDPDDRAEVTGDIERRVERYDFSFGYGLSNTWNLFFQVPYLQMEQTSSLATASADPSLVAAVDALQSKTLAGIGDVRVGVLQRPVFTDRNGFVWGFGADFPGAGGEPYLDNSTFDLGSPALGSYVLVHYTRYLSTPGERWDFRGQLMFRQGTDVTTGAGDRETLQGGSRGWLSVGWRRDFGPAGVGMEVEMDSRRNGTLDGQNLNDGEQATRFRLRLDFGNMRGLEQGPVSFPYRVTLQTQTLIGGFNTPNGTVAGLGLESFF